MMFAIGCAKKSEPVYNGQTLSFWLKQTRDLNENIALASEAVLLQFPGDAGGEIKRSMRDLEASSKSGYVRGRAASFW